MDNTIWTALALQGGGGMGAYEYGVLKALYEARPQFTPAVVTGISIGAINAAVLVGAKGDPIKTLGTLWRDKFTTFSALPLPLRSAYEHLIPSEAQQYLSLLGNPGIYEPRPAYLFAPWFTTSPYDLEPLRETLAAVIDEKKLNQSEQTRVVVSAVDVATGELRHFDNQVDRLSLDHILASSSLPPSFPATQIAGHSYWDGAVSSNTPFSVAINCLEELEKNNPAVQRELIVVELFPLQGRVLRDFQEVLNRLWQLTYSSKLKLDQKLFGKYNSFIDLFAAIDNRLPPDSEIRKMKGYTELQKHRKLDFFTVITFANPDLAKRADFSKATLKTRIEAGYYDAIQQRIGEYHAVPCEEVH